MNTRVLCTLLLSALMLTGCGRMSLYNDLTESQANQVAAALLGNGVDAEKKLSKDKKGWMVSVQKADMAYAMQILNAEGLPSERYETLGEVFRKKGFVSSPLEEKARYLHGLSQELSHTLSTLDGVRHARVHIAMPDRDVLTNEAKPSSASIVIVAHPNANIGQRETDIKAIVKDSIEGLDDVNKVTVKFFDGEVVEPPMAESPTVLKAQLGAVTNPVVLALLFGTGIIGWLVAFWRARRTADMVARERDARR